VAYCTSSDVERCVGGAAKLVQLTDFDANGAADTGVVDAAIAEADALIDSFAHKRFDVPFAAPAPNTITALSARHAARVLRRNRLLPLATDADAEERDVGWLTKLSKGEVLPGIDPIPGKSEIVTDVAGERDTTKVVSRERMKGFW